MTIARKKRSVREAIRDTFVKTVRFLQRGHGWGRFKIVNILWNFGYSTVKGLMKNPNGTVPVGRFQMRLDPEDSLGLSVFGVYEPFSTEVVKQRVEHGQVAVDVGANIGYYTLLLSDLVGTTGKVFAFEPDLGNFSILKGNLDANHCLNVIPEQEALSDETGNGKLYLNRENRGDHRIFASEKKQKSVAVRTVCLDDYLERFQQRIDFVKIDVQGAEYRVLRGMEKTLRRSPNVKILMEYWPYALRAAGAEPRTTLEFLSRMGFDLWNADEHRKALMPLTDLSAFLAAFPPENTDSVNLFAAKREAGSFVAV